MPWDRLKKIVTLSDDSPVVMVSPTVTPGKTEIPDSVCISADKQRHILPPSCRTPMGTYVPPPDGKLLTSLGDPLPGPADYLPRIDLTKKGMPHYSIVGRPKFIDDKRHLPGPFVYNTAGDALWKGRKITLKGRGKCYFDAEAEKSISILGKYKLEHRAMGKEGPRFRMGGRPLSNVYTGPANSLVQPVDTKGFNTPGPNYRPNSCYWGRGPKMSFGHRNTDADHGGPGPGDYDVQTDGRGPAHSFGIKLPEPVAVQQSVNKFSPAANTYDIGTTIGKAPAISIAGRPDRPKKVRQAPSPTSYNPQVRNDADRYRGTTLAYKWFDPDVKSHPGNPGPADYHVRHVTFRKNPDFTCRRRVKTSYPDSVTYDRKPDDGPGPGAYDPNRNFGNNEKPAFSFRQKLEPPVDKERFPGPNAYAAERREKPGSKRAPSFSMGKRLMAPNNMKDTPGPGQYSPVNLNHQTGRGKYSMTSRPKGKDTYVNPVAPNKYVLPELMSNQKNGVVLKSRASPYVYSGFRTNRVEEPRSLHVLVK